MHVFGQQKEAGRLGETPHMHMENMQRSQPGFEKEKPCCCEAVVAEFPCIYFE